MTRTTTESRVNGRTAPAATCAPAEPKAASVPSVNAATAAPRVNVWSISSVLILMRISVTDRAHARREHGVQLTQRRLALAERVEVVPVDDRIVRRIVECFAHHVTRPIERREPCPHR